MTPQFDKLVSECGISYYRYGSGPCLILIHGVGLRAESWYRYAESLSEHFDLIILDLPGHGKSRPLSLKNQQASLSDYTRTISDFVATQTQQPFFLCGHSLGSLIAIEMAATLGKQVLAIAALNAIYGRSDEAFQAVQARAKLLQDSKVIVGVEETIERWFGKKIDAEQKYYASLCEEWLQASDLDGYATAYKTFADQRGPAQDTLNAIVCPSLYMTGDLDLNSSSEMSSQLAALSTPPASALVIEDAGHMMPLTHASQVSRELIKLKNIEWTH